MGVIIDDNLTWNDHVNALYNKLLSNKRLLQNAKNLLSNVTLKHIYYAHIHSHLTYGLSIWGSMIMKKMKKTLYQIQTNCLKLMSNKKKESPQSGIYTQHTILPFPMLIKQELIKLGYKLSKNHLPTPIKTSIKKKKENNTDIPLVERTYQIYVNILIPTSIKASCVKVWCIIQTSRHNKRYKIF